MLLYFKPIYPSLHSPQFNLTPQSHPIIYSVFYLTAPDLNQLFYHILMQYTHKIELSICLLNYYPINRCHHWMNFPLDLIYFSSPSIYFSSDTIYNSSDTINFSSDHIYFLSPSIYFPSDTIYNSSDTINFSSDHIYILSPLIYFSSDTIYNSSGWIYFLSDLIYFSSPSFISSQSSVRCKPDLVRWVKKQGRSGCKLALVWVFESSRKRVWASYPLLT